MLKKAKIFHPSFIESGPHLRPQLEQVKHAPPPFFFQYILLLIKTKKKKEQVKHACQEQQAGHKHHKAI